MCVLIEILMYNFNLAKIFLSLLNFFIYYAMRLFLVTLLLPLLLECCAEIILIVLDTIVIFREMYVSVSKNLFSKSLFSLVVYFAFPISRILERNDVVKFGVNLV